MNIWLDISNSPHINLFRGMMSELGCATKSSLPDARSRTRFSRSSSTGSSTPWSESTTVPRAYAKDDLLLYGDKISMAHSLEARVPMPDIELVRFVESLPREYRVSLHGGKIAHRSSQTGVR
jgi:hypothetical protein